MTRNATTVGVDTHAFDAWLFDLDGVVTDTASVHAAAWKRAFDSFLRTRAAAAGEPFEPFEIATDYVGHVDGKPRYEGVAAFLAARGIALPQGTPDSPAEEASVCGLGNRKNALFNQVLQEQGVTVFDGSLRLIRELKERGKRVAVVTSSKNCDAVLNAAGLSGLFEVQVDGKVAAADHLHGKPDPETYTTAAALLGTPPARAVVVEDAIAGVQAGRDGGFGLVVGVARHDDPAVLKAHGADLVVTDLAELQLR